MRALTETVVNLVNEGADPNDLQHEFEKAVLESDMDWALWGDGRWRKKTVCSECGSPLAGLCEHPHTVIPLREWLAKNKEVPR